MSFFCNKWADLTELDALVNDFPERVVLASFCDESGGKSDSIHIKETGLTNTRVGNSAGVGGKFVSLGHSDIKGESMTPGTQTVLTMKCRLHTLSALLAVGLFLYLKVQVGECQHVPGRCVCLKTRIGVLEPVSDFKIMSSGAGCGKTEIILTLKNGGRKVCLSPKGPQAKRLLKCWKRAQKEGTDGMKCKRRLKPRARKTKVKSKLVKS